MTISLHKNDLPAGLDLGDVIAVDTETLGLIPDRDPLCLLQLCGKDGNAHIVQLDRKTYEAPVLKNILEAPAVVKIFHYARFDIGILNYYMEIQCAPVYCTRTASKLARTYTDKHGLRELCKEFLGVELNKQQQASDWGVSDLTEEQLKYAANDVIYLHEIKDRLDQMLAREGRTELAQACFDFLPVRSRLDLAGWRGIDIFEH